MKIGNKTYDTNHHTYIMGILNVTPDSFSDGGKWNGKDAALKHVEAMITDGMHIVDVGGESTRPGYTQICDEEEIARIAPVIEQIKENFDIPISVDTYKSRVASAAISCGADLINDIWGLKYDTAMADVIAKSGAACCLMHNRKTTDYQNFMEDVMTDLSETLTIAGRAGIDSEKIMIDPGVGFAKSYEQNLAIIRNLDKLLALRYPILIGTSRKSVIGLTLDLPANERLEGTLATTVYGMLHGASFVRVHDVKEHARIIRMTEAIVGER